MKEMSQQRSAPTTPSMQPSSLRQLRMNLSRRFPEQRGFYPSPNALIFNPLMTPNTVMNLVRGFPAHENQVGMAYNVDPVHRAQRDIAMNEVLFVFEG